MKISLSDKIIAWLALLSGLSISAVAIYYSVAGLVSIFAAAVIPITIMGVVLEVGKLSATVWLKQNWLVAPRFLKGYLLVAITVLMLITSMGIFGYLSKAHLDQAVPTGDVAAKVSLLDEKIKTEKENIDAARRALKQMDEAVDQTMARSDSEQGATRSVQLRRSQQAERTRLQKDIATAQSNISRLNEERAPVAAELRKVEAEVGPIKYIAALIYGDNPEANLLEAAVRWVIIIIVLVFDPLAVILLLASQYSFAWFRKNAEGDSPEKESDVVSTATVTEQPHDDLLPKEETTSKTEELAPHHPDTHPYLRQGFKYPEDWQFEPPLVATPEVIEEKPSVEDDDHEISQATDSEKAAMKAWKADNPEMSLKLQRRLLERGAIKELPWMQYLKPKEDFVDEAVVEAQKWAEENPKTEEAKEAQEWAEEKTVASDERPGDYLPADEESKKKDLSMDGEGRGPSSQENQRVVGYIQNSEQNANTLWQKVKQAKGE